MNETNNEKIQAAVIATRDFVKELVKELENKKILEKESIVNVIERTKNRIDNTIEHSDEDKELIKDYIPVGVNK